MADHGHHDPGGHELEAINTKLLFRLLISLSLVTLLAAAAVVQWFYSQRRELEGRYAAEGSYQLTDYKTKMSADLEGIDRVAVEMAANPASLQAPPAPPGWIHPDDLVGGGTPAAAAPEAVEPPPPPLEPEPEPVPVEVNPEPAPEADEPVEVKADKPKSDEPKADEPKADKPKADKPKSDEPKSNNGKGDENKADKADKPADKPADNG